MADTQTSGGIGVVGLLTVAFVVLKLADVIEWSWWWVLSPIWIIVALTLAVVIVIFGGGMSLWFAMRLVRGKRKPRKMPLEERERMRGAGWN